MKTVTETGWLIGGPSYIGGDGTGWELQADDDLPNIAVDVEQVLDQALKFKDRFVAITGYYTTIEYIERGPVEIFVAEHIRLTSDP